MAAPFFLLCRICILCILSYRLFICLIMIGTKKEKKKGGRRVHNPHNFLVLCIFILLNIFLLKCQKKITSLFQNVQLLYNKRAFLCYGIEIYWNPSSWKEKGESILIAISNSLLIKWRTVGLNIFEVGQNFVVDQSALRWTVFQDFF